MPVPMFHRVDGGVLLLVTGLFLAAVLAHRYWRAKIRLEDELEARDLDARRAFERYRTAFRALPGPAAFADRATGLVMEATPGWLRDGLPGPGDPVWGTDPELETAWRALPPPGPDHAPAPDADLALAGRGFRATFLAGPSLGVVLLVPKEG